MSEDLRFSPAPPWTTVNEESRGDHRLFDLRRLRCRSPSTGREHVFLRLEAPDWVNVVPVTPEGELILVVQYRHGTDSSTVEIPGGTVDQGEEPAAAAARELEEETGHRCEALHLIGTSEPNPAFLSNTCWTYLAVGCTPSGTMAPDPSEEITVHRVPLAAFGELIDDGTIRHALVLVAHDHLQRGLRRREPWAAALAWNGDIQGPGCSPE
jgi:8-oxo-dGTP pyrophosphatase MutT (NUDIX family)